MGKIIPLRAQGAGALTVAEAVETFLERDWSEHTRRNFASDLKRFCETFWRRRVHRVSSADCRRISKTSPLGVTAAIGR